MKLQMEYLVHNLGVNKGMEGSRCSSSKVERKIIEKNRRNLMKNLYSKLNSLLHHNSKKPLSLPDQVDEAVNYIKSLQKKLKESKEKKESLMGRKRSYKCTNCSTAASLKSPEISINELGSAMEVVLSTGPESHLMFYKMIRIFHEERAQVLNASFSVTGNIGFQIVHAHIGALDAAKIIKEKLNKLAQGSSGEQELEQEELWDYEFGPDTWDFLIM